MISDDAGLVLAIRSDRRIEFGAGIEPEDAARRFCQAIIGWLDARYERVFDIAQRTPQRILSGNALIDALAAQGLVPEGTTSVEIRARYGDAVTIQSVAITDGRVQTILETFAASLVRPEAQ